MCLRTSTAGKPGKLRAMARNFSLLGSRSPDWKYVSVVASCISSPAASKSAFSSAAQKRSTVPRFSPSPIVPLQPSLAGILRSGPPPADIAMGQQGERQTGTPVQALIAAAGYHLRPTERPAKRKGENMGRRAFAVVLGLGMALAMASPAHAIVYGEFDDNLHPNVGTLVADWQEPFGQLDEHDLFCSGTLIAQDVFLTASHCTVGLVNRGDPAGRGLRLVRPRDQQGLDVPSRHLLHESRVRRGRERYSRRGGDRVGRAGPGGYARTN